MISRFLFWLKLAWWFRTPFVYLTDREYHRGTPEELQALMKEGAAILANGPWEADVRDCDDFAAELKGLASRKRLNWIGTVYGWRGAIPFRNRHAFNVALVDGGFWFIEPQKMQAAGEGYHAWMVIL